MNTEQQGWYGVELDGALAETSGFEGIERIGKPVGPVVGIVKDLHRKRIPVRVVTWRVNPDMTFGTKPNPYYGHKVPEYVPERYKPLYQKFARWDATPFVVDWCAKNLGFVPRIVPSTDHATLALYSATAKQVVPNDGTLLEDVASKAAEDAVKAVAELSKVLVDKPKENGWIKFWLGFASAFAFLASAGALAYALHAHGIF